MNDKPVKQDDVVPELDKQKGHVDVDDLQNLVSCETKAVSALL